VKTVFDTHMSPFIGTNMNTRSFLSSRIDPADECSLQVFKQSGMTLLEVMVVVAIIGILASLSTAGLQGMAGKTRLTQAVTDLRGNMARAKMTAVKEKMPSLVVFNATSSPGSYKACINANGNDDCDSGEDTIFKQDFADYSGVSLQSADFSGKEKVVFNTRGLPESVSGGLAPGSVNCTDTQGNSRKVVMSSAGRLRIE